MRLPTPWRRMRECASQEQDSCGQDRIPKRCFHVRTFLWLLISSGDSRIALTLGSILRAASATLSGHEERETLQISRSSAAWPQNS